MSLVKKPKAYFGEDTDSGMYMAPIGKKRVIRSPVKWVNKILNKIFGIRYEMEYALKFVSTKIRKKK